jgi:hypothetical protein
MAKATKTKTDLQMKSHNENHEQMKIRIDWQPEDLTGNQIEETKLDPDT